MKKMICLVLVAMMLIPAAVYACDEPILPNIENTSWTVTGAAYVAVSEEYRLLCGKLYEDEKLEIQPARSLDNAIIRGIMSDGIIREKAEMKYILLDGAVYGLTRTKVTIEISAEYWQAVEKIVIRRLGRDEEITAAAIMACTLGRTDTTVYHYLYGRTANYIIVGTVIFNGKDSVPLCMGDWNGDGLTDIGFPVFIGNPCTPEPAATPEPVIIRDTVYVKETVVREVVKEKTCVKVIQVNNQININSTVTNCQKVIIGGGCKKAIPNDCIKE